MGDRRNVTRPNAHLFDLHGKPQESASIGKLTISDTDLILIDIDPNDPLDFYLDDYKEQLVAGALHRSFASSHHVPPQLALRVRAVSSPA